MTQLLPQHGDFFLIVDQGGLIDAYGLVVHGLKVWLVSPSQRDLCLLFNRDRFVTSPEEWKV